MEHSVLNHNTAHCMPVIHMAHRIQSVSIEIVQEASLEQSLEGPQLTPGKGTCLTQSQLEFDEKAQIAKLIQNKLAAELLFQDHKKKDVYIIIIGLTGSGKSSLINKLCRGEVADVGDGAMPCQHTEYVKEYLLKYGSTTMHIYDTRGLSDPTVKAKSIFGKMRKELKKVDLLLLCHRLYSKVDQSTYEMGKKLKQYCGPEMFEHAIIVLTQADEYRVHMQSCDPESTGIKVNERIDSTKRALRSMLVEHLKVMPIDCFFEIPVCISSNDQYALPTTDNWEADLWNHIARRCRGDAATLLGFLARNWQAIKIYYTVPQTIPEAIQKIGEDVTGSGYIGINADYLLINESAHYQIE